MLAGSLHSHSIHRICSHDASDGSGGPRAQVVLAREPEHITRQVCVTMARDELRIPDAERTSFAACHRLSPQSDAGVIVRFTDLSQRNKWLMNAKNLKDSRRNISISPDIPPPLRVLKKDILNQRKNLPADLKQTARIQYLKEWPYVKMTTSEGPDVLPTIDKNNIITNILGTDPLFKITEPVVPV